MTLSVSKLDLCNFRWFDWYVLSSIHKQESKDSFFFFCLSIVIPKLFLDTMCIHYSFIIVVWNNHLNLSSLAFTSSQTWKRHKLELVYPQTMMSYQLWRGFLDSKEHDFNDKGDRSKKKTQHWWQNCAELKGDVEK